ncbi:hypothetical protein, partial [Bacteroides eggerthii]|uniref:hypothetical protein n=1 Tax=Bacteroides eggerthii TaxID=28111 RepID=UPI0037433D19
LPNIFGKFFLFFFFLQVISLAKGRTKKKNCRYRPGFKKIVKQRCSHFESGCKGKNFISYTPNKSEVFFSFFFLKAVFMKQTAPNNKKKGKGSYSVSVRMSNYRRPRSRKRMQK